MKRPYVLSVVGVLLLVLAVLIGIYVFFIPEPHSTLEAIALAECLREKGAVMYGAEWCPHCQNEKRAFGKEAFARIPYVECPVERATCAAKGIQGFPTWILGGSLALEGEQGLVKLATQSGCPWSTPNPSPEIK